MHNPKVTKIQLEVKENRAQNTKVTNIQLEIKEHSARNTKVTNIQVEVIKTVQITLKKPTFK